MYINLHKKKFAINLHREHTKLYDFSMVFTSSIVTEYMFTINLHIAEHAKLYDFMMLRNMIQEYHVSKHQKNIIFLSSDLIET